MIYVTKNDEGHWLNFKSASGKQASISIEENLLHGKRDIINLTIIETCKEDCIMDYSRVVPK